MFTTPLLCLAAMIYGEARGEPVDGQVAVAQVAMNRVVDHRWPDDVCSVVYQDRQFIGTISEYPTDHAAWARSVFIADKVITGETDDFTSGATHFYSGSTDPWPTLTHIGQIKGHTFKKEGPRHVGS